MLILTIRTDKPEAEIGLFDDHRKLAYSRWLADRQLAETIHTQIEKLLAGQQRRLNELGGVVVFQGPGSFTGLRIGVTVANAVAYAHSIPIVGGQGDNWLSEAVKRLERGENSQRVAPEYGAPPRVTKPR